MENFVVLQCFHSYLSPTENWAYRLIASLSNVENVITSKQFLKTNFYNDQFKYIEFPVHRMELIENRTGYFAAAKMWNKLVNNSYLVYPAYVTACAKARNVQIVHSHFSFVGWDHRKIAKRLQVPHVVSFYGFDYEWLPYNRPEWKSRYQKMFKEIDCFVCEGKHGVEILGDIGCPSDKIAIVRLGVDIDRIPISIRRKAKNSLRLIQIASLTEKKGHINTIEAFCQAATVCPNLNLTIVGREHDIKRKQLLDKLINLHLESRVKFIDSIPFDQLHAFLQDYDVFIHPSKYSEGRDCEGGAPVVLLDAQATGMPVISTEHCDIPDVVKNNVTGILVQENASKSLSEAIQTFYFMDEFVYAKFSSSARKLIENEFNSSTNAKRLREIYRKLIFQQKSMRLNRCKRMK